MGGRNVFTEVTKMGSVRKVREGVFDGKARTPEGASRQKRFTTERDAREWVALMEAAKVRGDFIDPKPSITLREFWEQWRADAEGPNLCENTLTSYDSYWHNYLGPLLGGVPVNKITRAHCQKFLKDAARHSMVPKQKGRVAREEPSPWVVRWCQRLLHKLMEEAILAELIVKNPAHHPNLPRVAEPQTQVLTPGEIEDLSEAVKPRWRAFVLLMPYGSLRFQEMAGLKVNRIDFLRRTILIDRTITESRGHLKEGPTKTKRTRTITVPQPVIDALAEHIAKFPPGPRGLVFHDRHGNPIRRSTFYRMWRKVTAQVGLPGFWVSNMRHTGAAIAYEVTKDIKAVSIRLGHENTRTTEKYLRRIYPAQDAAIADALERVMADPQREHRRLRIVE